MFTPLVRRQLVVFAIVATFVTGYSLLKYVQVSRLLDLGNYHVDARMPEAGGLYENAIVTYNGVQVGTVHDVQPTKTGVVAHLRIKDSARIPADLTAYVRSTSPVGEQYIDLRPHGPDEPKLVEGSVIPAARVVMPVPTEDLIRNVNALVATLPTDSLNTTLDELNNTFNGSGPALGELLTSATRFVSTAQTNLEPTTSLVTTLTPFFGSQVDSGRHTLSIFSHLNPFTGQLDRSDSTFRSILHRAPGTMTQISKLSDDLDDPLPLLMANLAADAEVLKVYVPNVKSALILGPPVIGMLQTTQRSGEAHLGAATGFGDAWTCQAGFKTNQNSPNYVQQIPKPSRDTYCRAPHDSKLSPRGARNSLCPNSPVRSAYAIDCGFDFTHQPRPKTANLVHYDPSDGRFIDPLGHMVQLGSPTGDEYFGPQDSRTFLLSPLSQH